MTCFSVILVLKIQISTPKVLETYLFYPCFCIFLTKYDFHLLYICPFYFETLTRDTKKKYMVQDQSNTRILR
jgi:hypothetical protein